jgi:hypothetical protein
MATDVMLKSISYQLHVVEKSLEDWDGDIDMTRKLIKIIVGFIDDEIEYNEREEENEY